MQYTTWQNKHLALKWLFYQDFKDTFVCNTQPVYKYHVSQQGCFIRISKILLYAIHNQVARSILCGYVVLSGFQRYFCMQYTTFLRHIFRVKMLFYQDFKDTFVCNTQPMINNMTTAYSCFIRISKILLYAIHNLPGAKKNKDTVVLSGFQRYFCMQYTTNSSTSLWGVVIVLSGFQ